MARLTHWLVPQYTKVVPGAGESPTILGCGVDDGKRDADADHTRVNCNKCLKAVLNWPKGYKLAKHGGNFTL